MAAFEVKADSEAVSGELTFQELVQRVHSTVASALAHADVAQLQIIAELARHQHLLAFNAIPYQVFIPSHHLFCANLAFMMNNGPPFSPPHPSPPLSLVQAPPPVPPPPLAPFPLHHFCCNTKRGVTTMPAKT